MKNQIRRLIVAAIVSSCVFALTWFWYQHTDNQKKGLSEGTPLAFVGTRVDEILRRPNSRLLWQIVETGDPLFNGEAIRTSSEGEVRIQFTDSDRFLDLEPDSLIIIKRSEGEIELDLLEGSLFVTAPTENSSELGLVLNSPQGKVDLSNAAASLSKSEGAGIDIQVLEGKASLKKENGQDIKIENTSRISVLLPKTNEALTRNPKSPSPTLFQWSGIPDRTMVKLFAGTSRKNLKEISTSKIQDSSFTATLDLGKIYWKLSAYAGDGILLTETPVFRTEVKPKFPPTAQLTQIDSKSVVFSWNKEPSDALTLEVWADADLQVKVLSKKFQSEDNHTLTDLQGGNYFWRISSLGTNETEPLETNVEQFFVDASLTEPRSASTKIDVELTPELLTQYYVQEPALALSWKATNPDLVKQWRVNLTNTDDQTVETMIVKNTDSSLSAPVKKSGRYLASIEALGPNDIVIATSATQTMSALPLPKIPTPQFLSTDPILAEQDGQSRVSWTAVEGAKGYRLIVRKDGKVLKQLDHPSTTANFKNLLPGEYDLELVAIDIHGRTSQSESFQRLIVPDTSNLTAPTLKKVQVK